MTSKPIFGDLTLPQRHRADLQLLGALQASVTSTIRPIAKDRFYRNEATKSLMNEWSKRTPADTYRDLVKSARAIAESDDAFRIERLYQRYLGEEFYVRGIAGIEQLRDRVLKLTTSTLKGQFGSLELDPDIELPRWHRETEWHLQPGGWHDYDLVGPMMGIALGPLVFASGGFAAVDAWADVSAHRLRAAKMLPKSSYRRVYEPGCGGIATLSAVHKAFPEAELVGSDLSPWLLKMGYAVAQQLQINVHLKQRDARNLREADASFDAVIMFALQHEMPVKDNLLAFTEAFRVLEPGGDIVISDPAPFHAVDPFQAVLYDWETRYRGEPFFTVTRDLDWGAKLADIGFVNIEQKALEASGYPYIIRASKPAA